MCFWTSSIEGTLRTFLRYFLVKQMATFVTHFSNVNEVFKNYLPLDSPCFGAMRKQFKQKKWQQWDSHSRSQLYCPIALPTTPTRLLRWHISKQHVLNNKKWVRKLNLLQIRFVGNADEKNWVNFGDPVTSEFFKIIQKRKNKFFSKENVGIFSPNFRHFKKIKSSVEFEKDLSLRSFQSWNSR